MQGGNNKTGTQRNADASAELEDFFAERNEETSPLAVTPPREKTALSQEEEIRRLTAYVAHLKERIVDQAQAASVHAGRAATVKNTIGMTTYMAFGIAMIFGSRFLRRLNVGS